LTANLTPALSKDRDGKDIYDPCPIMIEHAYLLLLLTTHPSKDRTQKREVRSIQHINYGVVHNKWLTDCIWPNSGKTSRESKSSYQTNLNKCTYEIADITWKLKHGSVPDIMLRLNH